MPVWPPAKETTTIENGVVGPFDFHGADRYFLVALWSVLHSLFSPVASGRVRGFGPTKMRTVRSSIVSSSCPTTEMPAPLRDRKSESAAGLRRGFADTITPCIGLFDTVKTPLGSSISAPRPSRASFNSSAYSSASGSWSVYVISIFRFRSGNTEKRLDATSRFRSLIFSSGVTVRHDNCASSLAVRCKAAISCDSASDAFFCALPAAMSAASARRWAVPAAVDALSAEPCAFDAACRAAIASPCVLSTMAWFTRSKSIFAEVIRASPHHSRHNPPATSTQPKATTIFHHGLSSLSLVGPFSSCTAFLTSCWISTISISTPTVTRMVAMVRRWRSASLKGISASLSRLSSSTDLDARSDGTAGGFERKRQNQSETKNQRELRGLSIYWIVWAIFFVAAVTWRIAAPIIGLVAHLVQKNLI